MADQSASAGNDAVVVQIAGDNSTVEIIRAGAKLALNRLHTRKADPTTPIELLRTDIRATTFVGRAEQCRQLADWRASPQPIAICCYTGPAGAGKTRLAIEACETAEAEGWIAGFAPSTELARYHTTQNLVHWVLPQNALIVVDYAATSLAVLKSWFAAIAPFRNHRRVGKLRILLLERQADPEEGWWADLNRRESEKQAGPADLIGKTALHALPALKQLEDRRTLLAETMRKAAPLLDPLVPVLSPPAPGTDAVFDTRLADDRIDNEPLYLMMAGIHAARHGAPTALALNGIELAAEMAQIETARLEKFARQRGFQDNGELLKHLAACVTLQNGCDLPALTSLVEQEMAAQHLTAPYGAEAVANHLCDFLPSAGDRIEPVRPDLIGESFLRPIINGSKRRDSAVSKAIVLRAYHREPTGTVDTLVRCARDLTRGTADHPAVTLLSSIVGACSNLAELAHIANSVPQETLSLREFALEVTSRIVVVLRRAVEQCPDELNPHLAKYLLQQSVRLINVGRREDALEVGEEALQLYRTLAASSGDTYTLDLSGALNNLANFRCALGRPEEGLNAAEEAVRLCRAAVARGPYALKSNLAICLNNLATCLGAVGRREAAAEAAAEALQLRRTLAALDPDAFRPDLPVSLTNLANRLSALGRPAEALVAAQEAVQLNRELVASCHDAFAPNLAVSLNSLAGRLRDLDRTEEALAIQQEATERFSALAVLRPSAFTPNLAGNLANLATYLGDLGRCEEALAAAEKGVCLYRALAASNPEAFTPDMALSLSNMANYLNALDRPQDALPLVEEAVRLHRELAAARPDVFAPHLARSLSVLATTLAANGQNAEAIDIIEQSVRLLLPHFSRHPDAFDGQMRDYVKSYLARTKAAGLEPDIKLLISIGQVVNETPTGIGNCAQ